MLLPSQGGGCASGRGGGGGGCQSHPGTSPTPTGSLFLAVTAGKHPPGSGGGAAGGSQQPTRGPPGTHPPPGEARSGFPPTPQPSHQGKQVDGWGSSAGREGLSIRSTENADCKHRENRYRQEKEKWGCVEAPVMEDVFQNWEFPLGLTADKVHS